jgi:Immunoglobulin domain
VWGGNTDDWGYISDDSVAIFVDGPRFISQPSDQSADLGAQQAVLSCDVDSYPLASIEWTQSGNPVGVLGRSAQLTISPVTRQSFTTYTCTANVSGFAPISADVRLLMNGQLNFVECKQLI